jgi:hypothetical protein
MAFLVSNPTHRLVSFFIKKMRQEDVPHLAAHHARKILRPALVNVKVGPQKREDLCLLAGMTEEELSENREVRMMLTRGSIIRVEESVEEVLPEEPKQELPKEEPLKEEQPKKKELKEEEPKPELPKEELPKKELKAEEEEERILSELLGEEPQEVKPVEEILVDAPKAEENVPEEVPEVAKETILEITGDERWNKTPFGNLEPDPKFKEVLKKKPGRPAKGSK